MPWPNFHVVSVCCFANVIQSATLRDTLFLSLLLVSVHPRRVPENWVVFMLRQLVEGVHGLHSAGFVHLDLSIENTMFDRTTSKCVYVCMLVCR